MVKKVFRIPDGDGGWSYRIQSRDGRWLETDESGNPLPGNSTHGDGTPGDDSDINPGTSIPKERKGRRPSNQPKDGGHVNISIRFPKEDYKELTDYIHWRCLFREPCTKASFLLRLGLDAVRKDREYRDFRKKNP